MLAVVGPGVICFLLCVAFRIEGKTQTFGLALSRSGSNSKALAAAQSPHPQGWPFSNTHSPTNCLSSAVSVFSLLEIILRGTSNTSAHSWMRRELAASPYRLATVYSNCCMEVEFYSHNLEQELQGVCPSDVVRALRLLDARQGSCMLGARHQQQAAGIAFCGSVWWIRAACNSCSGNSRHGAARIVPMQCSAIAKAAHCLAAGRWCASNH